MIEPAHDELADDQDELGWDRAQHGRMRDQDTDDDAIETTPFEPGAHR